MPVEKTGTLARDITFASLGVPAPLVTVLDGHPHLQMPGNSIEVLEMLSMPGM